MGTAIYFWTSCVLNPWCCRANMWVMPRDVKFYMLWSVLQIHDVELHVCAHSAWHHHACSSDFLVRPKSINQTCATESMLCATTSVVIVLFSLQVWSRPAWAYVHWRTRRQLQHPSHKVSGCCGHREQWFFFVIAGPPPPLSCTAWSFSFHYHFRFNCLAAVCFLQAWMMWNFITFHLKRIRERSQAISANKYKFVSSGLQKKKDKKQKGNLCWE